MAVDAVALVVLVVAGDVLGGFGGAAASNVQARVSDEPVAAS